MHRGSAEGHVHGRPRPSAPAFSAEDSFPLNRLPGGCASQAETQEARKGQQDAEHTHGPTENTPATRPLRERKCLRVHRASGLHFPEFVRSAFLSGSASDYTVPGLHLPECQGKQSRGSLSRKTTVPKMPERKDSRQVPTSGW